MQPAAAPAGNGNQPNQGINWFQLISQLLIAYFFISFFFGSKPATNLKPTIDSTTGNQILPYSNFFEIGHRMDVWLFVTDSPYPAWNVNRQPKLVWHETNLTYDFEDYNSREKSVDIELNKEQINNGTIYGHVFVTSGGMSPNPNHDNYDPKNYYKTIQLNRYGPKPVITKKKSLLSSEKEEEVIGKEAEIVDDSFISYWRTNISVNLVVDHTVYPRNGVPQLVSEDMQFVELDGEKTSFYYPILFLNDFWSLNELMKPINETTPIVTLQISYYPLSQMKWQFYKQMSISFNMQQSMGARDSEIDDIKVMILETNVYLLGLTMVVSLLHMVFDFLAFKNDISFWKNAKSMEGLSVRTIFLNTFCQLIIFLYLLDNNTSWMILMSSGIGLLIEAWKIQKACVVKVMWWRSMPYLTFTDKETYTTSQTKEHDAYAMKKLSYVLYVLIVGYSIYSLIYQTHKSWYSWVLSSLTGTVYTFGFVMMTPQLFINYKMKSVAHLPWRTMVYKALNTFIDDLFAFIIRMPTLHRIACFRDDIIFFIYLYQRWIYPVDMRRTECGEMLDENGDVLEQPQETQAIEAPSAETKKNQ